MTTLRRTLALTALLLSGVLVAAGLQGSASARPLDARCLGRAPIPASALTGGASLGCSLAGRVVYDGQVSVVVPPAGVTVAGEGIGTGGEVVGLQVSNSGSEVRATTGATGAPTGTPASTAARSAVTDPCKDRTFHLEGHHWKTSYRFGINVTKAPSQLRKKTLIAQIKAGNNNMRKGRNSCGLKKLATPLAHYTGTTKAVPNIKPSSSSIRCGAFNRTNVVGFGNLPGNLLGWTCYWWLGDKQMGAADMMLDNGTHLVTKIPAHCNAKWDFEGTVTHEFGHVYGMAHSGNAHRTLTMDHIETPCSTYARTLGLGDWLGMRKMYGTK
jgi:hypothetical protein